MVKIFNDFQTSHPCDTSIAKIRILRPSSRSGMDHHPTQILVQMSKLIKSYMHQEAMKILITQMMRLSGRSRAQQVWKWSKKIRRDNWCLLFIVIRGWSYQVPMCGRVLLGLNFTTPNEECTDVGLSCPDLEKVGRREVSLLNAVRCQISKMKSKSLLQIFSLVCYYNDDSKSKKNPLTMKLF